jgi:predicted permease
MNPIGALRNLWRSIAPRSHGDVEEELRSHQQAYQEDLMRQGLTAEEAQRKARIDLGQPATQNETYRAAVGLRIFDELGGDIRYGLRALGRNPGFAAVAVLSLAVGIGATTAMFSLIYAVLLHPFPYADADRIMNPVIINEQRPDELRWFAMWKPQFELLGRAHSIESLLGFRNANKEITGAALPEDVMAIYLTENAGTFFGVHALLGRGIQQSDAQSHQPVVVLNYKFWQRHFSGDPHVIGRTLELDHAAYTIVGVMPRSFAFNAAIGIGDVYLPRNVLHDSVVPPVHWPYTPWIKLKPQVTLAAADAELGALVRQFAKENPRQFPQKWHLQLQPIIVPYEQNTGRTLYLLLAGVLLLLIIGCANCSILLLARGRARQHELAVRTALGASRWRIVRQLLVEALVISFTGSILGAAASYWLAQLSLQLSPDSFPPESVIRINLPILAFSIGLALLSGVLFGLMPALRLSRPDLARALPTSVRGLVGAHAKHRWNILIAAQVALTLLLMATAGTAIRSFLRLTQLTLGYNPDHVLQAGIVMHFYDPQSWHGIQSRESRAAFIEQIKQKIAAIPGVTAVAASTGSANPPYSGVEAPFEIAGGDQQKSEQARGYTVSPDYFATLQIPLLRGRIWSPTENARGDFVAIVNQSFATRYWPNSDPLNQQLRIPDLHAVGPLDAVSAQSTAWRQIVGVVGDSRNDGVDNPVAPAIYVPYTTMMPPFAQFLIRTQDEPLAYLHSIRAAVASVAPDQQIANGTFTLNEAIEHDAQYTRQRLFSILFGVFSAMALALALVGIFSVVAYSVAQRTTEFGVRLALGAPRSHVLWVAARIALVSTAIGVAIGLALDAFLGKLLADWMHSAFAATELLSAAALLALSALLACALPARRATAVPPAEALRYE